MKLTGIFSCWEIGCMHLLRVINSKPNSYTPNINICQATFKIKWITQSNWSRKSNLWKRRTWNLNNGKWNISPNSKTNRSRTKSNYYRSRKWMKWVQFDLKTFFLVLKFIYTIKYNGWARKICSRNRFLKKGAFCKTLDFWKSISIKKSKIWNGFSLDGKLKVSTQKSWIGERLLIIISTDELKWSYN